jgi:hypothetical protein
MKTEQKGIPVTADQYVRLECVRLAYRPDKDEQTIIDKASKLEAYVINGARKPAPKGAKARQGTGDAPS